MSSQNKNLSKVKYILSKITVTYDPVLTILLLQLE